MTENGREGTQGGPGADTASPVPAAGSAENGQAGTLPRCQATNRGGERCGAAVRPGGLFCVFHDPELEPMRVEARRRGGITRAAMLLPVDLQIGELDWRTADGLLTIIAAAAEAMLAGRLDPSRQRALSDSATKVLAALHGPVLDDRLAAVEAMLAELEAHGDGGD